MASAGVRGRPISPLVLSAKERAYLERQIRRHRIERSLSERCRIILRCADGLASKDVAVELAHLIQPDWNFELTGLAQSVELA